MGKAHDALIADICCWLELHHFPHSRINQRPVQTSKGWRTPGADVGTWDIVSATRSGVVVWIDAKTGKDRVSTSQKKFQDTWERRTRGSALFIMVRSTSDLEMLMQGLGAA